MPLPVPGTPVLLVPAAIFTALTGLFVIVGRRSAIVQALGYLAMENGIAAFGMALAEQEPLLVEMGTFLDAFVAVFVMGITIFHINREFDHIDSDRLSSLKDSPGCSSCPSSCPPPPHSPRSSSAPTSPAGSSSSAAAAAHALLVGGSGRTPSRFLALGAWMAVDASGRSSSGSRACSSSPSPLYAVGFLRRESGSTVRRTPRKASSSTTPPRRCSPPACWGSSPP